MFYDLEDPREGWQWKAHSDPDTSGERGLAADSPTPFGGSGQAKGARPLRK